MHCNGKCYLAKQLKRINPDNSNEKKTVFAENDLMFFILPEAMILLPIYFLSTEKNIIPNIESIRNGFVSNTFQPPPFLV